MKSSCDLIIGAREPNFLLFLHDTWNSMDTTMNHPEKERTAICHHTHKILRNGAKLVYLKYI
eukprot:m.131744 g.131744  ORF g.131744 m.131744 type:complete len:62 (-) comp14633_c0_seq13:2438-2623(-)